MNHQTRFRSHKILTIFLGIILILCTLTACKGKGESMVEPVSEPFEVGTEAVADSEPKTEEASEPENSEGTVSSNDSGVSGEEGNYSGSSMEDAIPMPLETYVYGTATAGNELWYTITINDKANSDYRFFFVNKTFESGTDYFGDKTSNLYVYLYEEDGKRLGSFTTSQSFSTNSGNPPLRPNSTYYLAVVSGDEEVEYTVSFDEAGGSGAQNGEGDAGGDLIFETPFELNETQIRFVSNKDTFVNEEDAKKALEPVAEILLSHPDHPILIAGTTATVGSQESSVTLSNKRAEAVKRLLKDAFGIPESQIVTIGLGFELDPFVRGKDIDSNGKFVESEAAKNRRVVIVDINDPIAQKLINK